MNKKIEIRRAQPKDLEVIYNFERKYFIEHEPKNLKKWESFKSNTIKHLAECLDKMFIAAVDNESQGYGYWNLYEGIPCVYSIYINPKYRGMGIAFKLMVSIEEQIKEAGYDKVTLSTLVKNNAQHLFNKLGYKLIKEEDGWLHYFKEI